MHRQKKLITIKIKITMAKKSKIQFVEVDKGKLTVFTSGLEKMLFMQTHTDYELVKDGNAAIEPLYYLIDTEGTDWNLTPNRPVTWNEAQTIIEHYY